jgi:putative hemolysin
LEIALLTFLILLNGTLAMSEIALVTARRSRLERIAENGDLSAAVALRLAEEPTQFLSTIQIGITAIGILNGIVGEAALSAPLSQWLQQLGMAERTSALAATSLVVVGITYISIVIGELVPKRFAQHNAESIARFVARPISLLAHVSRPFVFLLTISTDGLLKLLGKSEFSSVNLTEDDIYAVLVEGSQAGLIEKHEHDMVRNVFRLDDRQIGSLMTPRSEFVYLDLEQPIEGSLQTLIESDHSRFPVCRGGMGDLVGVITAKRLLKQHLKGKTADISDYLLSPVYVPESLTGMKLLEQFRESGVQMVFVVDEYGEVLGLVTLQDLLEAVTGEFKARDPDDYWAVQREDGSWLLDGLIPVPVLKDRLELKLVPEEEKGRYHTLSGMMMWLLGRVPRTADTAVWEGWQLEVVDLDGNRVDKVLAQRLPPTEESLVPEQPVAPP